MKEDKKKFEISMVKPEDLANIHVVVWDMDGSLYRLDGEGGVFNGSSLERMIALRSVQFIMDKEGVGESAALALYKETLQDEVGTSRVLARRYGITRQAFFDVVWDIDPRGIVQDFEIPRAVVEHFARLGKQQFLLTAAPNAWRQRVLSYLGLDYAFARQYNGEMFGKKDEVFAALANEFDPKGILSIGDQLFSDIEPAFALGMSVYHVPEPAVLSKLMTKGGETS